MLAIQYFPKKLIFVKSEKFNYLQLKNISNGIIVVLNKTVNLVDSFITYFDVNS